MTYEQDLSQTGLFSAPENLILTDEGKLKNKLGYLRLWNIPYCLVIHTHRAEYEDTQLEERNKTATKSRPGQLEP